MNKYLHTVASVGFLFTLNYDARNHELKENVERYFATNIQGGSNMTGTGAACLHTNQSRSYLNHLVSITLCKDYPTGWTTKSWWLDYR